MFFVISIFFSIGLIIHGIFFDLNVEQIKRLTLGGFILTFLVIFPSLLIMEYIFNINNKEIVKEITMEIKSLKRNEKRFKKLKEV